MKINLLYLPMFVITLGIAGCSKTGPAGPQGEQGKQGEQGASGLQGIPGDAGSTIYSNNGAPSADVGKSGDYYLDKSTGDLYGPRTDQGWGTPISLKGQQGSPGAAGAQGPKGDTGTAGAQGPKGDTGATGAQGPKGDTGATGAQGPKGDTGATGAQGPKGDTGAAGQNGKDGSQILTGTSAPLSSVGTVGDYYWNTSSFSLYGPKTSTGWGTGISLRGPKGDPGNANVLTSGWFTISADKWTADQTHGTAQFSEPSDLDLAVALNAPYQIGPADADGAILLYVNNGHGIRLTSFQTTVNSSGTIGPLGYLYNGVLEFRFVIEQPLLATDTNLYLYPIVALESGTWDWGTGESDQKYIQQTYLPSIEWKVVVIPTSSARKSSPPPNPKDYKATCAYYGIAE
jgi:hypothetical protein